MASRTLAVMDDRAPAALTNNQSGPKGDGKPY